MSSDKINRYNQHLESIAEDLDISPSTYKKAVESYKAVGSWLDGGDYAGALDGVSVSPQGSFEHGTIIKPLKKAKKAGYDIDLVCELSVSKSGTSAQKVKQAVGDRLKEHGTYKKMLDEEGRRCWTLEYAKTDGGDFHLDVLPSVAEDRAIIGNLRNHTEFPHLVDSAIAITHKSSENLYSWKTSNPRGYSQWFKTMNEPALQAIAPQARKQLFERHADLFASVDQVPDQLIKTPLQQSIQLMKRHRDVRFCGHEHENFKPISMIITTLAAQFYNGDPDVLSALSNITEKMRRYSDLLAGNFPENGNDLIQRSPGGIWYIGNPVNSMENFADRWHEDKGRRAEVFFEWAQWVNEDLIQVLENRDLDMIIDDVQDCFVEPDISNEGKDKVFVAPTVIKPHIEFNSPSKPWCKNRN